MTVSVAVVDLSPEEVGSGKTPRDAAARVRYAEAALAHIPRLLGAIDRNPFRATYGCLDRQFWHYRTSSFPSEMYQEGVLPLALAATTRLPGNRWYGQPRVRELAVAALRFTACSGRRDGSCDDYYPFERALGAAAFSFAAATEAYRLLRLNDLEVIAWLHRRAAWLLDHDESGRLANHQALVALGLARLAALTGDARYAAAARDRLERVLAWQSSEGWFDEYGGADPGYQTVTIDCLAKYRRLCQERPELALTGRRLDESLRKAVAFARWFLHPDGSYAGPYGSRGTHHFYPHGMELLAAEDADAADLADGFLHALAEGRQAYFDDDRMFAHRLGNLIEAYRDGSAERPALPPNDEAAAFLPQAGLLVRRAPGVHTIVSAARGGVFRHYAPGLAPITDAGLIVELADGRVAVSQLHGVQHNSVGQASACRSNDDTDRDGLKAALREVTIARPLHFASFETATPLKQALLHFGMWSLGRFCRTAVRKLLQRRLITGRRTAPVRLTRRCELFEGQVTLRVTDTIELTSPSAQVRRMSFGSDHEAAYIAASGVYQECVLQPWTDLSRHVAELNDQRRVTVVREW